MPTKKTLIPFHLFVGAVLLGVALGCSPPPDTGAEYRDEATDAEVLTAQERADRREALTTRWQTAQDRLQDLRQKASADNVQNELDETVAEIDQEAADLGRQLDEFGEDSRVAWNEFEARVENTLDEISREIDEAAAEFE